MIDSIARWLRDGDDNAAAELIEQCEIDTHFVDLFFEFGGDRNYEVFDIVVAAPRRVHRALENDPKLSDLLESAIRGCAEADGFYVRGISWVPRTATPIQDKDRELSAALSKFDAEHVTRFWQKCLDRKSRDPDGAITAARSMLESVCKHILVSRNAKFDSLASLPNLFHTVLECVSLAPRQQTDGALRQLMGNCQAIVSGLAAVRNDIGDAHGKATDNESADNSHAELAVNLASAIAIFLLHKSAVDTIATVQSTASAE